MRITTQVGRNIVDGHGSFHRIFNRKHLIHHFSHNGVRLQRIQRCTHVLGQIEYSLNDTLDPAAIVEELEQYSLCELIEIAGTIRDRREACELITFSPKVFLPLTRLCRNTCSYCTFVIEPQGNKRAYMTLDEVVKIGRLAESQGCVEALLTLGDRPETKYSVAKDELHEMGYNSTIEYVKACAQVLLEETNLLPHINAGVVNSAELESLREVSVSQGIMLESVSNELLLPGMPHHECPDKIPSMRLDVIRAAGEKKIPFTTGLLIGIGDSRADRIAGLLKIKELHEQYGHIQEIIIQNFQPKKNTAMASADEPDLEELLFVVASARILFGSNMCIQAPPNLTPSQGASKEVEASWGQLIDAGINDWGGISPGVTPDYVNPEKPWPLISSLAKVAARKGKTLVPRLPIYPEYLRSYSTSRKWLHEGSARTSPFSATLSLADGDGLARCSSWAAGKAESTDVLEDKIEYNGSRQLGNTKKSAVPFPSVRRGSGSIQLDSSGLLPHCDSPSSTLDANILVAKALDTDYEFLVDEIVFMFRSRGKQFESVVKAADEVRRQVNGDDVSYVINRNINYTNICTYGCKFCAFSKGPAAEELRGTPYLLPQEEIQRRALEAWESGATEVCMQGGIHPEFTGETYLNILKAVKMATPAMHIHAFSPLEIQHGSNTLGIPVEDYLGMLRDAGLGSLPGTAAEILVDSVRQELCPDKLSTQEWVDIIQAAHRVGLKTTSTIMFGHIDNYYDQANHLLLLKKIQKETGGITEFVPLPFVHMEAPIYRRGKSRQGPTYREAILIHAIARLVLHPHITNIQASWVKMGPQRASELLKAGCNDMGGTLMDESITRAAGAEHGRRVEHTQMSTLITEAGRHPYQRTTLYNRISK